MEFSDAIVAKFLDKISGCKLYPNVAPSTAVAPYAIYGEGMKPINTKDGTAGYESLTTFFVAATSKAAAQALAAQIEGVFHNNDTGGRAMWLEEVAYAFFEAEKIHTYELKFNAL